MGVRGLSTFFNQNPDFFKPCRLHDSLVIIDGDNLIHALYFTNRVNVIYGGDYDKYAESVRRYLLVFLECNVKPIIIFDGGFDKSGRKLKTIFERTQTRLAQVKHIARNKSYYERVLPILARDVFISILIELGIPFAVCDYEADDQITALANYYKCPVISGDSDFYIYDVHKGFIRLDSIEPTVILDTDSNGEEYKFLNCNIYHIDEFVSCFPGIEKAVLPLFGTLIGNDYVEGYEFDNFFSNIQLPKYKGRKLILNTKQKKMIGLLSWLKNTTLNEAINQVMQYLKKDRREYVKSVIESAVSGYELRNCNLSHVIDKKLYNFEHKLCFDSGLVTPCGNSLPLDFIVKYHSGHYSSFFVNVIVSHKVFLAPQIEDISCSSSYTCSRYIRKIIYGILIRHDVDGNTCENEKCLAFIEENDRQRTSLQKELIQPIFSLEGFGMLPTINELSTLKEEECKLILTKVLSVNLDFLFNLPNEWQLLIGCINYWLRNCEPFSTEAFLYALIINLIYFSVVKHDNFKKISFECCSKNSAEVSCTCSSVICILSRISQLELQNAAKKLKKYLLKSSINHGNPLLLYILHSYSQLQGCIVSTITLNKLLGECLKNPDPHQCFSGTMLYNLTKDISTRTNPELFVAEILGRETTLFTLFTTVNSKICEGVPCNSILKNQFPFQKSKKKSAKHFNSTKESSNYALNKFDVLNRVESL